MSEATPDERPLQAQDAPESPATSVPEVIDQVAPLLTRLPAEDRMRVLSIVQTAVQYQGPLPPPDMLRAYNSEITDGANRIMAQWEKQTSHRIALENKVVEGKLSLARDGQRYGFAIAVLFGILALVFAVMGHVWLAGTITTGTLVALVSVFVIGKVSNGGKGEVDGPSEEQKPPPPKKPPQPQQKRRR